jgi:hypothetical protein
MRAYAAEFVLRVYNAGVDACQRDVAAARADAELARSEAMRLKARHEVVSARLAEAEAELETLRMQLGHRR